MAEAVAGVVVSGLLKVICDKLGSPLFQEIGRSFGVKTELKRLSHTFLAINDVLCDAEEKQTTQRSVRGWLLNLKDVAYDIEDVFDLLSTRDLEKKVNEGMWPEKIRDKMPKFSLGRKLKAICDRLDEISANRRNFNLKEGQPPRHPRADTSEGRDQSSFVEESSVFGRKEDQDWIVSRLVSSSSQEISEIPVLPIVGIGGMGKTTLAKLVFNDPRVGNFMKLWASIPKRFTQRIALESLIEAATGQSSSNLSTEEALKNKLRQIIAGETFLIVLDNVWFERPEEWLEFRKLLEVGSKSSRIIVTIREERVASYVGNMEEHKLKPLSDDHCWSIFAGYAFGDREKEKEFPSLVRIGKEIVRKCHGVPLAAMTLGSQLWSVRDELSWRRIEESKLWEIEQVPSDIIPALKLSYDLLPSCLRACFSICPAVRREKFLHKTLTVEYWMALGFIEVKEKELIEDVGARYVNELVSRSFFQVSSTYTQIAPLMPALGLGNSEDYAENFLFEAFQDIDIEGLNLLEMHDLVHDLAAYVTGEETAFVSFDRPDVSARVKHLVWEEDDWSERELPCQLLAAKKARSFRIVNLKWSHLSKSFLHSLISNFTCLRILSLWYFQFEDLPNSIGDLKHLRFLLLGANRKLKRLPNSMSKLVNLQTLNFSGCWELELFPRNLHRLLSLRHLDFTSILASFPGTWFHGWTSIHKITIFECARLTSISEQIGTTLTTLRILDICSCPNLASLPNSMRHLTDLERLKINSCEKLNLSGWKGLKGLTKLRQLGFSRLPLLVQFPDGLQCTASLQHLTIEDCSNLIKLPDCLGCCTFLLKLKIFNCLKLRSLPRGIQALASLEELRLVKCPAMNGRYERDIGEDWNLIRHIPIITIRN